MTRTTNLIADKERIYRSERGIKLMLRRRRIVKPTITVEDYLKWYSLYIVNESGRVIPLSFGDLPKPDLSGDGCSYTDHVPNPRSVVLYANRHKYDVDDRSFECIVGRWELEATRNYDDIIWEG